MRTVQGVGSGLDIASSLCGHIISYRGALNTVQCIETMHKSWHLFYSGYKVKTNVVLAHVAQQSGLLSPLHDTLYQAMGQCTAMALSAIKENDNVLLGGA